MFLLYLLCCCQQLGIQSSVGTIVVVDTTTGRGKREATTLLASVVIFLATDMQHVVISNVKPIEHTLVSLSSDSFVGLMFFLSLSRSFFIHSTLLHMT